MYHDIEAIWQEYSISLMKYIKSKVQNEYDAEELAQEVFIKLYQNIDKINDESKIKSYIYKAAHNSIIDYYRKIKEISIENEELEEKIKAEDEQYNLNEDVSKCLKKFILTLPPKYQMPVTLHDLMGKKHKDIAEKLNISVSGSKTRVQRGREKLKDMLLECCDFEFDRMGNIIDYKRKHDCECGNEKN